jgi:Ca2+-binding RTX toxin-like protein
MNDNIHSDIETIWGSPKKDYLVGTSGPQSISGFDGLDTLDGGGGADDMHGGDDIDQVTYASRNLPVNASLDGVANDGIAGEQDNIETSVEGVIGGQANDTLTGNNEVTNYFYGGPGSDTETGLGGHDQLSGDAGNDTLDGGAGGDSFEILGGPGTDVLNGGPDDDVFWMGFTSDGADQINGGSGPDTLRASQRSTAVDVSLDNVANDGATGEGDNVSSSVENVVGGSGPDTITGSAADNTLAGGDGKDSVKGFTGDDEIAGGDGVDSLFGGAGADLIHAVDGFADSLSCGTEMDKYAADGLDSVDVDCEQAL